MRPAASQPRRCSGSRPSPEQCVNSADSRRKRAVCGIDLLRIAEVAVAVKLIRRPYELLDMFVERLTLRTGRQILPGLDLQRHIFRPERRYVKAGKRSGFHECPHFAVASLQFLQQCRSRCGCSRGFRWCRSVRAHGWGTHISRISWEGEIEAALVFAGGE